MPMQMTTDQPVKCNPLVTQTLAPLEKVERWPAGANLFSEGEQPSGVYFLHSGETDLLFSSKQGDVKALLVAEAGQLLGVSCVVSGRTHDCSATTKTPCVTGFIPREQFLRILEEKPGLWFTVLQMISSDISACWDCMRTLGGASAR